MPIPPPAATSRLPGELPRHHRQLIGRRLVADAAEHPSGEASMDAADSVDTLVLSARARALD
jgi:hypothetical protein